MASIRKTPPHVAVVLAAKHDPDLEMSVAFWTEAVRRQMSEDVQPAWHEWDAPPGVFFYGTGDGFPDAAAAVVAIIPNGHIPDAAGWHEYLHTRVLGFVDLSRSIIPSRTLSHEVLELWRNPFLNQWTPSILNPKRLLAIELCDQVQHQGYEVEVTLFGRTRRVEVGDFTTPAWYYPWLKGPKTFLSTVDEANEIGPGGYQIAKEGGDLMFLADRSGRVGLNATRMASWSRTGRIIQGVEIPVQPWQRSA